MTLRDFVMGCHKWVWLLNAKGVCLCRILFYGFEPLDPLYLMTPVAVEEGRR